MKKNVSKTSFVSCDREKRGRYLLKALVSCAECHSPRGTVGGLKVYHWMQGGKNLSAAGKVPNLINKVKKLVCRRDGRIFVHWI